MCSPHCGIRPMTHLFHQFQHCVLAIHPHTHCLVVGTVVGKASVEHGCITHGHFNHSMSLLVFHNHHNHTNHNTSHNSHTTNNHAYHNTLVVWVLESASAPASTSPGPCAHTLCGHAFVLAECVTQVLDDHIHVFIHPCGATVWCAICGISHIVILVWLKQLSKSFVCVQLLSTLHKEHTVCGTTCAHLVCQQQPHVLCHCCCVFSQLSCALVYDEVFAHDSLHFLTVEQKCPMLLKKAVCAVVTRFDCHIVAQLQNCVCFNH